MPDLSTLIYEVRNNSISIDVRLWHGPGVVPRFFTLALQVVPHRPEATGASAEQGFLTDLMVAGNMNGPYRQPVIW